MKKVTRKIVAVIVLLLVAFIYYYVALPAVNIHSTGFWSFLIVGVAVLVAIYAFRKGKDPNQVMKDKGVKAGVGIILGLVAIFLIGSILSSPIINAKKYQQLLTVENRDFIDDIEEVSYDKIPLLDKDSASLLGNRKMGSLIDMVSQFEVGDYYTQINYKGTPVRVTPLKYASPIKWLTNQSKGIPAYMKIDMATRETECIQLTETIKYSPYEYLNRNLYRHLRFNYPTYIFDSIDFELDEEGTPYWTCSVKEFKIGLFGGTTVGRLVLCNAITGETTDYAIEDVPTWVDRAYSAELLISLYDYYGSLKHGYFNSILGQKDCLKTTDGYNYIALDDDVWVYTGVTSVSGDQSNVGFVLMNQRTKETRFYSITGADENSAMGSAEGQVQNLGYKATFPLLLNIADEPTYFLALKDSAGLVKKYAMIRVQDYQCVGIGDTVVECEKQYISKLKDGGISNEPILTTENVSGTIEKIVQSVIGGNSHYYILLKDNPDIFDVSVSENLSVIRYNEGDTITFDYTKGTDSNKVLAIK